VFWACRLEILLLSFEVKFTEALWLQFELKPQKYPGQKKKVQFKVEVKGELNFTAFVARQRVNHYLVMSVGMH